MLVKVPVIVLLVALALGCIVGIGLSARYLIGRSTPYETAHCNIFDCTAEFVLCSRDCNKKRNPAVIVHAAYSGPSSNTGKGGGSGSGCTEDRCNEVTAELETTDTLFIISRNLTRRFPDYNEAPCVTSPGTYRNRIRFTNTTCYYKEEDPYNTLDFVPPEQPSNKGGIASIVLLSLTFLCLVTAIGILTRKVVRHVYDV